MFKAFKDKAFETFVMHANAKNDNEIFDVEYEGKKYWIKKGRKTSSNLFHKLAYKLLPFEFLIPVMSKTPKESVLFESNKLMAFKESGLNVPEVMGSNENFFVMSDCGMSVYAYLKYQNLSQEEFEMGLNKYILEVCHVHNKGFFHGGAQSRNFTYVNGTISAIDLEDSFDESVDLKTLQFRDLLLILLSMTKVDNFDFSYNHIIHSYIEQTNHKDFLNRLRELSLKLKFLVGLNSVSWIHNMLPRDVKGFCKLLEELQKV